MAIYIEIKYHINKMKALRRFLYAIYVKKEVYANNDYGMIYYVINNHVKREMEKGRFSCFGK